MPEEYADEKIVELLEKMPNDLREVFFSQDTASRINDICGKLGIPDEKIPQVTELVSRVLLQILPVEKFKAALEEAVELKKNIAEQLAEQIDLYIFSSVREKLIPKVAAPKVAPAPTESNLPPKKSDTYRETIG